MEESTRSPWAESPPLAQCPGQLCGSGIPSFVIHYGRKITRLGWRIRNLHPHLPCAPSENIARGSFCWESAIVVLVLPRTIVSALSLS